MLYSIPLKSPLSVGPNFEAVSLPFLVLPVKNFTSCLERPNILPNNAGAKFDPPVTNFAIFKGSKVCLMPVILALVFSDKVFLNDSPMPWPSKSLSAIKSVNPVFLICLAL